MPDALFDIKSTDWNDVQWLPKMLIQNIRKEGPEAVLYQLEGHKFHMGFLGVIRPKYSIWNNKYDIGKALTTQTNMTGPFIELSFIIRLQGSMVLKDIDSVMVTDWQFNLTHLPFVDSKVSIDKDAGGETLDFYFTVGYMEDFCRCYPALAPLVNDYHRGKPNNFLQSYPVATPEIQARVLRIKDYLFNEVAGIFKYETLDQMVEDLLVAVLSLKKNMVFLKLSPEIQRGIKEAAMLLETNFDQVVDIRKIGRSLNSNLTYFERAFKELYGVSPRSYRKRAIMKAALLLLKNKKNDDSSIKDIALQLGYLNGKAFSREFIAFYGYAPSRVK